MESFRPVVGVVALAHTAVCSQIVPLKKDKVPTEAAGQLELVMKVIFTV